MRLSVSHIINILLFSDSRFYQFRKCFMFFLAQTGNIFLSWYRYTSLKYTFIRQSNMVDVLGAVLTAFFLDIENKLFNV